MPSNKKIRAAHRQVSIGDMRWLIDIYDPTIQPPNLTTGVDYTVLKIPEATVWAAVRTVTGTEVFDGMNTTVVISHEFFIRWRAGVTKEKNIVYPSGSDQYYDIVTVENFENRNEFLMLRCNIKGTQAS